MKKIIAIAFLLCFGLSSIAQETYTSSGRPEGTKRKSQKKKGFDTDRLIYGGGLTLGFGNGYTNLGISPMIGYAITPKFSAGVSLAYQYFGVKNYWAVLNRQTAQYDLKPLRASIYSGGVWARYVVWNNLFAHTEFEYNTQSFKAYYQDGTGSFNVSKSVPSLLVGAGFRQPISDRASFLVMALYDVLNKPVDPYDPGDFTPYGNNIFFRAGFAIGF